MTRTEVLAPSEGATTYDAAVLDWGIGGFGFVRAFRALHPEVRLLYISDSGRTPYGMMTRRGLSRRVGEVAHWVRTQGAERLIVACNAASSALDGRVHVLPVHGIIEAGVAQILAGGFRKVAVLGGRRTILSRAYARPLRIQGVSIVQRVAQPLSALVERGDVSGAHVDAVLVKILRGLGEMDAILLACTHYPALEPAIRGHLPEVRLLDPAGALARAIPAPSVGSGGLLRCFTTGSPSNSRRAAVAAFDLDPGPFVEVRIGAAQSARCLR